MEQSGAELAKEILHPQKVLRVKEVFGVYTDSMFLVTGGDPADEEDVVKVFEDNGYVVSREGKFNRNNPLELGIYLRQKDNDVLAKDLGLPTLQKKPVAELLQIDYPVVVKLLEANRGESKYLLETEEQRARFLTWILCFNQGIFHEQSGEFIKREVPKLLERVRKKDLTGEEISQIDPYSQWILEEYMDTASDFNTSYRIVVDGFGNLHYGQINKSAQPKGEAKIVLENKGGVPFFDRPAKIGDSIFSLLLDKNSPLYIDSKDFRSNIAQGGERIMLNGQAVHSDVNRDILTSHGIDPEKPEVPLEIMDLSRKVGIACRDMYPYVGVDFIQDKNGKYYFLEANIRPRLNPEGLGLRKSKTQNEISLELMKKIANTA